MNINRLRTQLPRFLCASCQMELPFNGLMKLCWILINLLNILFFSVTKKLICPKFQQTVINRMLCIISFFFFYHSVKQRKVLKRISGIIAVVISALLCAITTYSKCKKVGHVNWKLWWNWFKQLHVIASYLSSALCRQFQLSVCSSLPLCAHIHSVLMQPVKQVWNSEPIKTPYQFTDHLQAAALLLKSCFYKHDVV